MALGFAAIAALTFAALPAWAQEFVKVEDGSREQLPATPFVAAAYGFIWVAVLLYVFSVARGLGRVQAELEDLRRRLGRATGGEASAATAASPSAPGR